MKTIKSINPSNGKVIGEVKVSTKTEVESKIADAQKAKFEWWDLGVSGRVHMLRKLSENLVRNKEKLAKSVSIEMGMPISLTRSDVDDGVNYLNWYLDNAEKYLSPEVIYEDKKIKHTIYHEPIGVSANITPWNFPISNFVWSVPQSLVSGNTVVYKTSEEVQLSGKLLEEILEMTKLPVGVFSEVYGGGDVGKILVNGNIDLICFTGSTTVGKYLYKVASEKFIKVFLELGGSAPGIVFEDADVDRVIESIFGNRFLFCGQVCDGLKRLIVHEKIKEKVVERLVEKIRSTKIGNPLDEGTEIGPMISKKQLQILERQVKDATDKGAKILIGGIKLKIDGGFFYEPTILTNIKKDMLVWKEEVFGPVLPVVTFKNEDEALGLANDTKYGLGGYVFTEDKEKAKRFANKIDTGMVQINNASYLKPCSPFGGYKESGVGREHGKFGFHDLTQIKLISEEI